MNRERIDVCGVLFDCVTKKEALARLETALDGAGQIALVTANPEIVLNCEREPEMYALINACELVVADGMGVIRAAKILHTPLPERIPGIELGEELLAYCSGSGCSVFFLGGKPGVADAAAEKMKEKYPALIVAGVHDGYFDTVGEENAQVVTQIAESGAGLVLVCLGSPKQEKWIAANRHLLPKVGVFAGLGGSLDIFSGRSRRAPAFFRRTGLEWFYRLCREPSRFSRMVRIPLLFVRARAYRRKKKKHQSVG